MIGDALAMTPPWNKGSEWHRWDPHIHTPSTLFNNQFKGDWNGFLSAIEDASPTVEALGITDYCVIDSYLQFRKHWQAGRASNVRLIFPNIEFRLSVETEKKKGINLHLLFSPEDTDHIEKINRALSHLTFDYKYTTYRCTRDDLIRLGRAFNPSVGNDRMALERGAEQFKLSLEHVRRMLSDAWAAENCLIAIVTKETDGTGGLKKDGAFDALQEEIKALGQIVFSGLPSDREFWLGRKPGFDRALIETTYGGLKPCLHGSDAHEIAKVLKPDQDRFCWIRSELSFTGLKQTLLEPDVRVAIGPQPPPGPSPSESMHSLSVRDAPWLKTTDIELNNGLVAIIGPKGSGKTALADMIADVAGASIEDESAFLMKAKEHLHRETVELVWGDGTKAGPSMLVDAGPRFNDVPTGVRYLSQQSVERLCSSDNLGRELLLEIEKVVFEAIPEDRRLGASHFAELRALRIDHILRERTAHLREIQEFSATIAREDEQKAQIPGHERRVAELAEKASKEEKDLQELLPKHKEKEAALLAEIQKALEERTKSLQHLNLTAQRLQELTRDYARLRQTWEKDFESLRGRYSSCELSTSEWSVLAPSYRPGVEQQAVFDAVRTRIDALIKAETEGTSDSSSEVDLSRLSVKELQSRQQSLTAAIGVERDRAKKHAEVARRLAVTKSDRDKLEKELVVFRGADGRRKIAIDERRKLYAAVFETFVEEQALLEELYAPLKAQLAVETGVERRLDFYVRRRVDVDMWVRIGEGFIDLRKAGQFRGHGTLAKAVGEQLHPAWRTGGAAEIAGAMDHFIATHMRDLIAAKLTDVSLHDVGRWLFSTDHVSLEYGIKYDGVDISRLSPGLRGIVLLMLYLAVDQWDTRPLVVDQPEENLDPHSVYEELVKYFRAAKQRRQVILVTHNPNLVVNADADQVIIASSQRKSPDQLPEISYESGGLEDRRTRSEVCRILEGGERAFLERERRYSIRRNLRTE